jgi:hypothetical protein
LAATDAAFVFKAWGWAKPCRVRLFPGVLAGIGGGPIAPLLMATIMFVCDAVSSLPDAAGVSRP